MPRYRYPEISSIPLSLLLTDRYIPLPSVLAIRPIESFRFSSSSSRDKESKEDKKEAMGGVRALPRSTDPRILK